MLAGFINQRLESHIEDNCCDHNLFSLITTNSKACDSMIQKGSMPIIVVWK